MSSRSEFCRDGCATCRAVILRTYSECRACGDDDPHAFKTAVHVLSLRHPELSPDACIRMASEWLSGEGEG